MRRRGRKASTLRAACGALRRSCCTLLELASLAALFRCTQHAARSTPCIPLGG
jgi:hypothetical protein